MARGAATGQLARSGVKLKYADVRIVLKPLPMRAIRWIGNARRCPAGR